MGEKRYMADSFSSTDGAGRDYVTIETVWIIRKAAAIQDQPVDTPAASIVGPNTRPVKVVPQACLTELRERTRVLEEALRKKLSVMWLPITGPFTAEERHGFKMAVDELQAWLSLAAVAVEDGRPRPHPQGGPGEDDLPGGTP